MAVRQHVFDRGTTHGVLVVVTEDTVITVIAVRVPSTHRVEAARVELSPGDTDYERARVAAGTGRQARTAARRLLTALVGDGEPNGAPA